jgi:NADP-dependent 3-hydroxy acid dehydrogenase YdfG
MDSNIPTYPDLAGKVAVVTGSSRGIGAATCRLLAASGARVVVNGRDQAALQQTVDKIRAVGGEATAVAADVAEPGGLRRLREETERAYGPAEVLGAFVGGGGPPPGPTAELTEPEWDAAIRGNLTVTFLTLQAFLPGMVERRRGAIVTMASTAARFAGGERIGAPTGYAAAKARGGAAHPAGRQGGSRRRRPGQLRVTGDDHDRAAGADGPSGPQGAADGDVPDRPAGHARGRGLRRAVPGLRLRLLDHRRDPRRRRRPGHALTHGLQRSQP